MSSRSQETYDAVDIEEAAAQRYVEAEVAAERIAKIVAAKR